MDRGYIDFARLHALQRAGGFFVTRATGLVCDQSIALDGFYTQKDYPDHILRVQRKAAPKKCGLTK